MLEQLYTDIAELEGKKNKLVKDRTHVERDSDSSRDALSEMDAVVQLENQVAMKNRHIRKLLSDVNVRYYNTINCICCLYLYIFKE